MREIYVKDALLLSAQRPARETERETGTVVAQNTKGDSGTRHRKRSESHPRARGGAGTFVQLPPLVDAIMADIVGIRDLALSSMLTVLYDRRIPIK